MPDLFYLDANRLAHINPTPFLESNARFRPPSNQQPMIRTKSPPYIFFLL